MAVQVKHDDVLWERRQSGILACVLRASEAALARVAPRAQGGGVFFFPAQKGAGG